MIGRVAFDFILRRLLRSVAPVALIIEILIVNFDDVAADSSGLRIPADMITLGKLRHYGLLSKKNPPLLLRIIVLARALPQVFA
jgi:hypothetical protein